MKSRFSTCVLSVLVSGLLVGGAGCNQKEVRDTFISAAGGSLRQGVQTIIQGVSDGLFSLQDDAESE